MSFITINQLLEPNIGLEWGKIIIPSLISFGASLVVLFFTLQNTNKSLKNKEENETKRFAEKEKNETERLKINKELELEKNKQQTLLAEKFNNIKEIDKILGELYIKCFELIQLISNERRNNYKFN